MTVRIGISAAFDPPDFDRSIYRGKRLLYCVESLPQWVMEAGALPFLLPSLQGKFTADVLISHIDGLILQGGVDVCPRCYGEEPLQTEWEGDVERDHYELALFHAALRVGKPILGICRGSQLVNVALGGTLYQDIATQVKGSRLHRCTEIYDKLTHEVTLEPGSHLASLYPKNHRAEVNSVHHQAIKDLAPDLVVEARCPEDGIIEAVRYRPKSEKNPPFLAGVQWHPEFQNVSAKRLLDRNPLMEDFLDAIQRYRQSTIDGEKPR